MKKMIKLSLVAAVAVAGLTTTASAANLEEAIKGVDVSGMIQYRYEDTNSNLVGGTHNHLNDYDAELTVKVPVNDKVTATVKLDVAGDLGTTATAAVDGDAKPSVNLEDVYFTYNAGVATVMAGKQNIPGPFSDGAQGTGAVALVPAGPVTIAAAYFNNHSVSDVEAIGAAAPDANTAGVAGKDVTALALIGNAGPVSFDVYYADVAEIMDLTSIHAAGTFGPVSVDARYSTKDIDNATAAQDDITLGKITVSGKVGAATLTAGYATTGDNNGVTVFGAEKNTPAVDNDNDAAVDFKVWQASLGALADADAFLIAASMPLGPVNASLTYVDVEIGSASDASEILAKVVYPMSKNFSVTAMYSQYEVDNAAGAVTDSDKGRLELKYTF